MNSKIAILMGSDSDLPYIEDGLNLLKDMNISYEIEVSSAHRTPERTLELVRKFEESGVQVILAAAGGAAHLPGVVAGHTLLPVIGIPIPSPLSGIDSLYSMVQMPGGIPVATFGIGKSGGINAILFAIQMLATQDKELHQKISDFRAHQREGVLQKSRKLKEKLQH